MKKYNRIIWESLDHYWTTIPYVFRIINKLAPSTSPAVVNKELTLLYITEGTLELELNQETIIATSGDLICFNTYVPHSQVVLETSSYVRVMIDSNFLIYNGLNPSGVYINEKIRDPKIDEMFSSMLEEFNLNHKHNLFMNSQVLYLVGYLTKNYSQSKKITEDGAKQCNVSNYAHIGPALHYINQNFKNDITLDDLIKVSKLSKSYFLKIFKYLLGTSPIDYINSVRCNYAKQLIMEGANITEASISSGFNSTSYFTLCFKKHIGCLPSEVLKNH